MLALYLESLGVIKCRFGLTLVVDVLVARGFKSWLGWWWW
jgi:hypothetical protein